MSDSPKPGLSKSEVSESLDTIEEQRGRILFELKMALETVKNIDKNILKSIELLHEPGPASMHRKNGQPDSYLNYNNLLEKNTEVISDILRMLNSL